MKIHNKYNKYALFALILFLPMKNLAQSTDEHQLLRLSSRIFEWEVAGQIDSLQHVVHEKFTVMSSSGERQTRAQYFARLTAGNFVHNAITILESVAAVTGNTGIVTGRGRFTVTSNGQQAILLLGYTEVFARSSTNQTWLLLAIHANPLSQAAH